MPATTTVHKTFTRGKQINGQDLLASMCAQSLATKERTLERIRYVGDHNGSSWFRSNAIRPAISCVGQALPAISPMARDRFGGACRGPSALSFHNSYTCLQCSGCGGPLGAGAVHSTPAGWIVWPSALGLEASDHVEPSAARSASPFFR